MGVSAGVFCLPGETDKVRTDTETSTSSCRRGHGWNEDIQYAKGGGGGQTNNDDLLNIQTVFRDGICRNGNHNTLNNVLNGSLDEFSEIEHIAHVIYYTTIKK
jgi:hypothetical protein